MITGEEVAKEVFGVTDPKEQRRMGVQLSKKAKAGARMIKGVLCYDGQFRAKKILGLWRYDLDSFYEVGERKSHTTNLQRAIGG